MCLCVYVCVYMCLCAHVYVFCACMCLCVICVFLHVSVYICMSLHICIYVHVCICRYVCPYMCECNVMTTFRRGMSLYVEDLEKGKLSSLPFLHSCAVTVAKRLSAAPDVAPALLGATLRPFPSEPPRPYLLSGPLGGVTLQSCIWPPLLGASGHLPCCPLREVSRRNFPSPQSILKSEAEEFTITIIDTNGLIHCLMLS